jgi:hypothetical protein
LDRPYRPFSPKLIAIDKGLAIKERRQGVAPKSGDYALLPTSPQKGAWVKELSCINL